MCVVHEHFPQLLRASLTRQAQQYLRRKQAEKAWTRSRSGDRMAHHRPEHAGDLIRPAMEEEEEDTNKEHVVGVLMRQQMSVSSPHIRVQQFQVDEQL